MKKDVQEFITLQVEAMLAAPSCSAEAKAAGQNWLAAKGTEREVEETKKLMAELELDIMPIDGLIDFCNSETGVQVFGKEMAMQVKDHARELKDSGAQFCDCPACSAAASILEKKNEV
ncbi:MAG TPA: molecular chaperone Hsp90 [Candidatus Dorea intestinavium]|nr:molecular chaperone Hsp90 [Candidatus Dorea intestinavium]